MSERLQRTIKFIHPNTDYVVFALYYRSKMICKWFQCVFFIYILQRVTTFFGGGGSLLYIFVISQAVPVIYHQVSTENSKKEADPADFWTFSARGIRNLFEQTHWCSHFKHSLIVTCPELVKAGVKGTKSLYATLTQLVDRLNPPYFNTDSSYRQPLMLSGDGEKFIQLKTCLFVPFRLCMLETICYIKQKMNRSLMTHVVSCCSRTTCMLLSVCRCHAQLTV